MNKQALSLILASTALLFLFQNCGGIETSQLNALAPGQDNANLLDKANIVFERDSSSSSISASLYTALYHYRATNNADDSGVIENGRQLNINDTIDFISCLLFTNSAQGSGGDIGNNVISFQCGISKSHLEGSQIDVAASTVLFRALESVYNSQQSGGVSAVLPVEKLSDGFKISNSEGSIECHNPGEQVTCSIKKGAISSSFFHLIFL